jgi:acetolactate decarboxylase
VPRDLIDDRLLGALHVRALTRAGLAHDPTVEHTAFQAGTLDALMAGSYDGDLTVGELLSHGDLGVGTVAALDGELVVVDGAAFVVDGEATVHPVPDDRTTPFAVVCRFAPVAEAALGGPLTLAALHERIERLAPTGAEVLAVRVDGAFSQLRLRSVVRQQRPYPPLAEVTAHQREWVVSSAEGSLVGFRFPDASAGLEVPGFHLHFLAADRSTGGHVLDLVLEDGRVQVDVADELHVELPPHVGLGRPGAADRAAIARVEGAQVEVARGDG